MFYIKLLRKQMSTTLQKDLKSCQRITLSLPKEVIAQLKRYAPKSQRSHYITMALKNQFLKDSEEETNNDDFLEEFIKKNPPKKLNKTAAELVRKDHQSH